MKKVKNTKNFTIISGVLFLRLTCCGTKAYKCLPVYIVNIIITLFLKRYINKLTNFSFP